MAIKAGQILHVANQFVVDRIQTGGAGQLNIPQEKVHELGNYQSVGIVRDVPDLTFSLECLDVDVEVEALLTGNSPADSVRGVPTAFGGPTVGTYYELDKNKPIDIISPWKTPYGGFKAVQGVAVPGLTLESASYRYGLTENAGETFSLRGDSIFYVPGTPWQDITDGATVTTATGVHTFENGPALLYIEGGVNQYALSVTVLTAAGEYSRKLKGTDYTETAAAITFTGYTPAADDEIRVVYGATGEAGDLYTQEGDSPFGTGDAHLTHQGTSVKPAAIRGKDIDAYFSTAIPGVDLGAGVGVAVEIRWPDVQSATIDWRVTLEDDREFGNPRVVSREATDVPTVSGAIEVKPRSVEAFFTRLRQITGIDDVDQIMGPQSSVVGALRVELRNPESGGAEGAGAPAKGQPLKTHYLDKVRFTMPGYEGRVQQKLTTTLNWESDNGSLKIYDGARV